jgi:hypothetical protein
MPVVTNISGGPFPAGSTAVYTAQLLDAYGNPIPGSALTSLTLTIVDTLSGAVVNGVQQQNILNTDRGVIDQQGNLTLSLEAGDMTITNPSALRIQRSLVLDWTYNGGSSSGRHQANFTLTQLSGA